MCSHVLRLSRLTTDPISVTRPTYISKLPYLLKECFDMAVQWRKFYILKGKTFMVIDEHTLITHAYVRFDSMKLERIAKITSTLWLTMKHSFYKFVMNRVSCICRQVSLCHTPGIVCRLFSVVCRLCPP